MLIPSGFRIAVVLLGPSASGKTAISMELLSQLNRAFNTEVAYISGDCFSAMKYPKTFDDLHLKYKYISISHQIEYIQESLLVVDDLFRRRFDYDYLCDELTNNGFLIRAWRLTPNLEEVVRRNENRVPPSRMPRKRLIRIYNAFIDVDYSDVPHLPLLMSPKNVAKRIVLSLVQEM